MLGSHPNRRLETSIDASGSSAIISCHANSPATEVVSVVPRGSGLSSAIWAPCGSISAAMRPIVGMSVGWSIPVASAAIASRQVASTSSVPMYGHQAVFAPPAAISVG